MYSTCPECETKFVISCEQIGPKGRRVRCSKCSYIWRVKSDEQTDKEIEPQLLPAREPDVAENKGSVNLPMLLPAKHPNYSYTMPIVTMGLIIFMLVMIFPKGLDISRFSGSNDLNIEDIRIQKQPELEKITVSYRIHNKTDRSIKMPLIRIRLFDKYNKVVKSLVDDHTGEDMLPDQSIEIKTEFVPAPAAVESLDIMIGNKVDFILK